MIYCHRSVRQSAAQLARITPIVGDALTNKRVAVIGRRGTARLIEYLACCGVGWFDVIATTQDEREGADEETCAIHMLEQLRARLEIDIMYTSADLESCDEMLHNDNIDLFIGTGSINEYEMMRAAVMRASRAGLFYFLTAGGSGLLVFLQPEDVIDEKMALPAELFTTAPTADQFFSRLHLESVAANYAKGLLLAGTNYARTDIEALPAAGVRFLLAGHPSWPWAIAPLEADSLPALAQRESVNSIHHRPAGKYLIIGLGSLGSVAAETLNRTGADLVLIDGEQVDAANPIRQIYRSDQSGEAKARACITQLVGDQTGSWTIAQGEWQWRCARRSITAYQTAITDDEERQAQFIEIIRKHRPMAAIVATGTSLDRVISQILRAEGVPHVVVSCYARARYFEAIVIDKEGPCFGCMRGHLYLGAPPELTPEERARYISSAQDLMAEPATRVETGRAADLAAHIAYGLAHPSSQSWLARALAEEETFFLGGNSTARDEKGELVYGIELPGEVRLFGLQQIAGRGDYLECWDCGRKLPVAIRYEEQLDHI